MKGPSPALVVALIALFVALGGTGYAAGLRVTAANGVGTLKPGHSESGVFTGGGSYNGDGWIGLTVVYPQPLHAAIADSHIVELNGKSATNAHCKGPGHAARGYLCLYDWNPASVGSRDFWSDDGDHFPKSMGRYGAQLYWETTGPGAYVGGSWTVTAP